MALLFLYTSQKSQSIPTAVKNSALFTFTKVLIEADEIR